MFMCPWSALFVRAGGSVTVDCPSPCAVPAVSMATVSMATVGMATVGMVTISSDSVLPEQLF